MAPLQSPDRLRLAWLRRTADEPAPRALAHELASGRYALRVVRRKFRRLGYLPRRYWDGYVTWHGHIARGDEWDGVAHYEEYDSDTAFRSRRSHLAGLRQRGNHSRKVPLSHIRGTPDEVVGRCSLDSWSGSERSLRSRPGGGGAPLD